MAATAWWLMERKSGKTAGNSVPPVLPQRRQTGRAPTVANSLRPRKAIPRTVPARTSACKLRRRGTPREIHDESIQAVHSAAGRHHIAHGGDFACRLCRVPAIAGLRTAAGRLSDHPGANALSWRQSRCYGVVRYGATRAAAWPIAATEPDDLDELLRKLDHYVPVRSRSQHRCGRAGGAGLHQRRLQSFAAGAAQSADL